MQYLKKILSLSVILLLVASVANAIDIEPEHDAIMEQEQSVINSVLSPIEKKPLMTPITEPTTTPAVTETIPIPITEPTITPAITETIPIPVTEPTITPAVTETIPAPVTQGKDVSQSIIQASNQINQTTSTVDNEQRIYYARSVTSNNPEYKTRFSILHNTPSPKRIAGERLYNLSDSFFRLSVVGNKIHILDNPVFNLTGINSATGRYGEIKILNNAVLNIHGTSSRFKGNWDIDGTGDRNLKITPTNLVSGTIPVHIKTFNPDGSVITDETHDLTFKALAMGPYNGYWSDGTDISVFLWGMSSVKMQSKEMTYLGLDLGIVTQNAPEATGATADDVEDVLPNTVIAPIAPLDNQVTSSIAPFGGGYASTPFIGGIGGGGFIGGGRGGSVINNNITNSGCFINNNGTITNNSNNTINCIVNNINDRERFCLKNPNHPTCKPVNDCKTNPQSPECCALNPNLPQCKPIDPCVRNPNLPQCKPIDPCVRNPNLPQCKPIDPCVRNPNLPQCKPIDPCVRNPNLPQCNPIDPCVRNPNLPQCNPIDPCVRNPNLPQCNPTSVSEPFTPLVFLSVLFAYCIKIRRKYLP